MSFVKHETYFFFVQISFTWVISFMWLCMVKAEERNVITPETFVIIVPKTMTILPFPKHKTHRKILTFFIVVPYFYDIYVYDICAARIK